MKETRLIKPKKSILNPVRIMNNKHRLPVIVVLAALFMLMLALPVLAAPSDPLAVINNLSSFIFSPDQSHWPDFAGFWYFAGGLITEKPRSQPEG